MTGWNKLTLVVERLGRHNICIIKVETRRIKRIICDGVSCAQCRRSYCCFECSAVDGDRCAFDIMDDVVVGDDDNDEAKERS